ncbi:D-tagatose-bisphosphate aldolase, class II, non-catalytic subunit [Xylanimonas sp. McL0601]|uniref:D-tagatose-bisphosphate aldolase, class II, non-catalytic subunit n=1 Tax=Xylanimonas sp. McL0601 TaxID=3414739 RepID=UPI003CEB9905
MGSQLLEMVQTHKSGVPVGIYAVCSAHPMVLEAAMTQARDEGTPVLIEATSNQVDQYGGYSGMTPPMFRDLVHRIAAEQRLPIERVILGGDHLGPNRWRHLPASEAMLEAEGVVAAYVEAGYEKIHLDCSMACAGDTVPLSDDVVAERAARLLAVAEEASRRSGRAEPPVYVIGTEVPVPGGAHEELGELVATTPEAAGSTLDAHRAAFERAGVLDAWDRIIALVVQPGVEFDHLKVVQYDRSKTELLRHALDDEPAMLFEAHSCDYQPAARLRSLVEDHWFVIKVGPGVTFALREALFALAAIEQELVPVERRSFFPDVVERVMLAKPAQWEKYYDGDYESQRIARRYSYSDRLRYYLPDPEIAEAQEKLLSNLGATDIPLPLLSQYLPTQYQRVVEGALTNDPRAIAMDRVRDALQPYVDACFPKETRN